MVTVLKDEVYTNLVKISNGDIELFRKETEKFLEGIYRERSESSDNNSVTNDNIRMAERGLSTM